MQENKSYSFKVFDSYSELFGREIWRTVTVPDEIVKEIIEDFKKLSQP